MLKNSLKSVKIGVCTSFLCIFEFYLCKGRRPIVYYLYAVLNFQTFEHSYFTRYVARYLRCSGIFKYKFVENLPLSLSAKELGKFGEVMGNSLVSCFLLYTSRTVVKYAAIRRFLGIIVCNSSSKMDVRC